ncbi:MAG TPA: condensation domain-containing protein, partial [Puia sp.]|nr:condensation domain-containing protein [Puia sp.]
SVGTVWSGRDLIDGENQVGPFIRILPLIVDISPEQTVEELLHQVKEGALSANLHQFFPVDRLASGRAGGNKRFNSPFYDIMIKYQTGNGKKVHIDGVEITPYEANPRISQFDLTFNFAQSGGGTKLTIEYDISIYKRSSIELLKEIFVRTLHQCLGNPDAANANICIYTPAELEMQAAWQRALGSSGPISPGDSFFQIGGTLGKAEALCEQLRCRLGIPLLVGDLSMNDRFMAFCRHIDNLAASATQQDYTIQLDELS